jgi:hypothetical protein
MTSPVFSDALSQYEAAVTTSVTAARAQVNTAAPGAVQSGIDFAALGSADLDFLQVGGDAINVFCQTFEAVITEALSAGILASSIISAIEAGVTL